MGQPVSKCCCKNEAVDAFTWDAFLKDAISRNDADQVAAALMGGASVDGLLQSLSVTERNTGASDGYSQGEGALLLAGANAMGAQSPSPLTLAVRTSSFEIVQLLLRARANANLSGTRDGWTPLFHAAQRGSVELCRLLITNHADPRVCDSAGLGVIDYAKLDSRAAIQEALLLNDETEEETEAQWADLPTAPRIIHRPWNKRVQQAEGDTEPAELTAPSLGNRVEKRPASPRGGVASGGPCPQIVPVAQPMQHDGHVLDSDFLIGDRLYIRM